MLESPLGSVSVNESLAWSLMTSPSSDKVRVVWLTTSNHWVSPPSGSTMISVIARSPALYASSS